MGDAAEIKESRRTFIVPAIKSVDHYDFARAKISCSLTWLIAKAFGSDSVPEDLSEPFYRDQYEQEHLKPPVVGLLLSAELYCRAGSLILKSDAVKPLLGHDAVIQALAQKGLYVTDQERLVTERDLQKKPIQMSSHLAMIDTLMMAYTVEMVSVERVMTCIQKFTPFLPEEDFPYDAEEAVISWINKVRSLQLTLHVRISECPLTGSVYNAFFLLLWQLLFVRNPQGRYRREDSKARPVLSLPLVDNLLKDNTDGCALAALLHFYCPDAVLLEDICVKETMSLADSLYNLQLIQEFCRENLNNCCHFTLEDMLYASTTIKSNYLVFMAELFWWCEVVKPSFVQPRTLNTKASDPSQSNKMAPITKQNLIHRPGSPDQSRSQPKNDSSAVIRRSSSMSYVDGCVGTWPKEKRIPLCIPVFDLFLFFQHNVMVFIAELFWWFEVVKPDFVKPRDLQEIKDVRASLQPKSSRPHVPISNATKRSFLTPSPSADSLATAATPEGCVRYYLHPEESSSVTNRSPSHSPSHPLLPLRQRQQKPTQGEEHSELRNRSNSLSRMDGLMLGSQFAWTERKQRPISQMEMDWERVCGDNISLARSISKDSLASNVISITPRHRINGQPLPQTRHYDNQEEEEELLAVINPEGASASRDSKAEGFFLEPLQPAVLRPNKEKTGVSKWEESGEGRSQGRRGAYTPTECTLNRTFTPIGSTERASSRTQSPGSFFLHEDVECVRDSPLGGWEDIVSDSEFEEDEEIEVQEQELSKAVLMHAGRKCTGEEEESAKLREDVCLRERDDKEGASGRASPCPSMLSQASSTSTGTGRMTSFAERRRHRVGFPDGCYSTGSSQTTTPDGSESVQFPVDASPGTPSGRPGLASELVHLRMQLEEKRRAIEMQKKKMENLSARQRLQLGKAAFLHVVKKGRSDTLPHPLKTGVAFKEKPLAKDDSCVEVLKAQGKDSECKETPVEEDKDNRLSATGGGGASDDVGGEPDLSECSRSIELLNEAIGAIQQQMMQLSVQQDLLMKQTVQSPPETKPSTVPPLNELPPEQPEVKSRLSVQFTETLSTATKRPPRLSSSRTPRTKPSDLKLSKDTNGRPATKASTPTPGGRTPRAESEEEGGAKDGGRGLKGIIRNTTFRLQDAANRRADSLESPQSELPPVEPSPVDLTRERSESSGSGKENVPIPSEENRTKAQLIEVDLSDLAEPAETSTETDGEQKSGLGFFFKGKVRGGQCLRT
ncbi:calmodulin-regulated spectrin-associated protein 1-B-like [Puntigrus tetrazona]|uniref:calmodulin-regulated spectrin-associated protein 1-B-like n=1 Tax=Puntigrus tetrazona TaxID=1606681 RepID=UPI001C8AF120|nr:calmodulin-regulated spectrin-associated protein 1-B-like [Puntigrus tetrazona]